MSLDLNRSQALDILNVAVTSSDTEITYGRPVRNFVLKSRGGQTLYYRITSAATNYITLLPGQALDTRVLLSNAGLTSASLGFIRTDAGVTDTVEVLVTYW